MRGRLLALAVLLSLPSCHQRRGGTDIDGPDLAAGDPADLSAGNDNDDGSAQAPDLRGAADLLLANLFGPADLARPQDLAQPPDLRPAATDMRAPADMSAARPPCMRGTGFAAFRFHYSPGSGTNAIVDAFGLPDGSNWEAVPAFATMVVDAANGGGLNVAGGNWILIRYSVVGLTRISGATLSIRGRSYSVSTSGSFEGWSPIYGGAASPLNSVSNAWPYTWTSVDYTGYVQVGDPIGLTGIRLYARGNSSNLVVNTVELCIDGA